MAAAHAGPRYVKKSVQQIGKVATPSVTPRARHRALALDPATGKERPQEADAVLRAEAAGVITAPVTRSPDPAADFIDGTGQRWDIKAFRSGAFIPDRRPHANPGEQRLVKRAVAVKAGAFTLTAAIASIKKERAVGQHILLDPTYLTPEDRDALSQAIAAEGLAAGVAWVP